MSRFRPVVSDRVPSGTHFAELFLSPGPQAIGATGDNSYEALYGRSWLLVWDRDDGYLHLFQEQPGGAWLEVVADLPPVFASPAPVGSRRWSLAFDQSARVILAYEDATGIVRVTRWDAGLSQYVQNVSFSAHDPCVVIDAWWSGDIPDSDVLIFYLSADRERVMARVQRELYAVEHLIWDFEAPVILDRVVAVPLRYQALVSDSTGAPLPNALLSALYPYLAYDSMAASATGPTAGDYVQVVLTSELAEALAVAGIGPSGGAYADPIIRYSLIDDGITVTAAAPTGGAYADPIINYALEEGLDVTGAGPTAADYVSVVIETSLEEGLDVTATGPSGGTYA